jgi:hypothetical protein
MYAGTTSSFEDYHLTKVYAFILQIKMPANFDPDLEFPVVVDGVHCKTFEPKHPTMPMDKNWSSHKFGKKAAFAYELAVSTVTQQLCWARGPYPAGGYNDIKMFKEGGLQRFLLSRGKKAIADAIYANVGGGTSCPNTKYESKTTNTYKRRARARMESFNGRIKSFGILYQTFRHKKDRMRKHQTCFEAVCIIVQYQMENGSPLFEV